MNTLEGVLAKSSLNVFCKLRKPVENIKALSNIVGRALVVNKSSKTLSDIHLLSFEEIWLMPISTYQATFSLSSSYQEHVRLESCKQFGFIFCQLPSASDKDLIRRVLNTN